MTEEKNETSPPEQSASPSSEPAPAASAPAAASKSGRNPVERVIVWGVIIALLVIVFVEFRANSAFQNSLAALDAQLAIAEANPGSPFLITDVQPLLVGSYSGTEPEEKVETGFGKHQEVVYTWKSLLREQKIYIVSSFVDVDRFEDVPVSNVIAVETEQARKIRLEGEAAAAAPTRETDDEPATE